MQSSPSTTAREFGETARPSVPSAFRRLSETDGSCLYNVTPTKLPQNQISFCNPSFFSCPHWVSPFRGLYLCLGHISPLSLKEDLTWSWTAWTGSKAARAWEGAYFTITPQEILIDFPFPLWALSRRCLWTSPAAGGARNGNVLALLVPSELCQCRPCTSILPVLIRSLVLGLVLVTVQPIKRIHKESSQARQFSFSPFQLKAINHFFYPASMVIYACNGRVVQVLSC